jgi:hypothetical protein
MRQKRFMVITALLLFVVWVAWLLFVKTSHPGLVGVNVVVVPEDATIQIDGVAASVGTNYLQPGPHVFTATKSGFKDDVTKTTVSAELSEVILLPEPQSSGALSWSEQGDIQNKRESLGGQRAALLGEATIKKAPIITKLPHYDISGPFSIDYGPGEETDSIFIVIGNSSPSGREKALEWIRNQGYDLSSLDIRFSDFTNPITGEDI